MLPLLACQQQPAYMYRSTFVIDMHLLMHLMRSSAAAICSDADSYTRVPMHLQAYSAGVQCSVYMVAKSCRAKDHTVETIMHVLQLTRLYSAGVLQKQLAVGPSTQSFRETEKHTCL